MLRKGGKVVRLLELVEYASSKYQLSEEHKWMDFPGFSVLADPHTGRWAALLMRQWDSDSGSEIELCDLKCGREAMVEFNRSWLSPPVRMRGPKWVNIAFTEETEPELVYRLFDRAVASGEQRGYTIVLEDKPAESGKTWTDTPLPFAGSLYRPSKDAVPEQIRQMRRLYAYGRETPEEKAKNFYRQGMFMKDYVDDVPWSGDFVCWFPTYHDLNIQQLRGYFTWRADIRKGVFRRIPSSAAYLYIYELLNGIGTASPEESLEKLRAFEAGYIGDGPGDIRMRLNLHRWMLDLAVLKGLPSETARQAADPEMLRMDGALAVLRHPVDRTDEEILRALCFFAGKKLAQSPVLTAGAGRGARLLCEIWRSAINESRKQGKDLFRQCFGEPVIRPWKPLANAVYYSRIRPQDGEYVLDECRIYRCRTTVWKEESFDKADFDRARFQAFLHEAERKLRLYLKAGRPLREDSKEVWASPYIDTVLEADRRTVAEASRPKITIDLSGLERIRQEALITRDSLLTEEERQELQEMQKPETSVVPVSSSPLSDDVTGLGLDAVQLQLLRALLRGEPVKDLLRAAHRMPSIEADMLNEALFDEIGDTVLLCEDDKLSLVEDYREDLLTLLGGDAP